MARRSVAGLTALALACIGSIASRASAPDELRASMTVMLVHGERAGCMSDCPDWLALTGRIDKTTPAKLAATLARLDHRRVPIVIDSPGGIVGSAIDMGRMIRARQLDVAVGRTVLIPCGTDKSCLGRQRAGEGSGVVSDSVAFCASACTLVLAGGVERSAGGLSRIGVHQMVTRRVLTRVLNIFRVVRRMVHGRPVVSRTLIATRPLSSRVVQGAASDALYSEVDRYLLGMGVTDAIMPLMRSTPSTGILWMSGQQLHDTRLTTATIEPAEVVADSVLHNATSPVGPAPAEPSPSCEIDLPAIPAGLRGSVSIVPFQTGGRTTFAIEANLDTPGSPSLVPTIGLPRFCDKERCDAGAIAGTLVRGAGNNYRFEVYPSDADEVLTAMRTRRTLSLPVDTPSGADGDIRVILSARMAVGGTADCVSRTRTSAGR